MTTLESIIQTIQPYVIGAIVGVIGSFGGGFVKEFFDERDRKAKHKRNVARQILKICNEASTGNYGRVARDYEHVNSVMTDLDGVDSKMGVVMNSFVSQWTLSAYTKEDLSRPLEAIKGRTERHNKIEENRRMLVVWANKITSGQ